MNKILKSFSFFNIIIFFIVLYLGFHIIFGKYNIGNYLINDFKQTLLEDNLINLKDDIESIDKDLYALYSNYEDFIDEVTKEKYEFTTPGEVLIKIN